MKIERLSEISITQGSQFDDLIDEIDIIIIVLLGLN